MRKALSKKRTVFRAVFDHDDNDDDDLIGQVRERPFFVHFLFKSDHFAKTGSGQT
jgi:hypothetical protein